MRYVRLIWKTHRKMWKENGKISDLSTYFPYTFLRVSTDQSTKSIPEKDIRYMAILRFSTLSTFPTTATTSTTATKTEFEF